MIIDVIPTMVSGLCGGQWKPNSSTPIWNHDVGGGRAGVDSIIFPPVECIKGYTKEDASKENIKEIVDNFKCVYTPYNKQDIRDINDFAFYLYKLGAFKPPLEILQDVIKLDPKRTVAYLNIADVYLALGNVQQAKKYYSVYYENMKRDGLLNKVPFRVLKQIKK
ncbi:tetratricopeptide repeat protein [Acinetobacter stercoris]|uniref:Uncharacterized protein n=1 Tax=Acinetobacter stercoris TaxID=2126983 RepID=A0A2U3N2G8_9GAMM|nr:tetratricopeptide repeat protein [Acinetobacter stercoris]SPL71880.1 hypothetical protein KPC_3058 [Acinetobacter stercoris]